jgi:hypothetical protein
MAQLSQGVDNVLQFTLVLASGEYVIANQYENRDLFWALRGGGGGTFGVVVTVTYRTHDILPFTLFNSNTTFATPEMAKKLVTEFIRMHPNLSDAGWGGYSSWSNSTFSNTYLGLNISLAEANATMSPFIDHAQSIVNNPNNFHFQFTPFSSFYEFYDLFLNTPSGSGGLLELTSRLMSRKMAQESPEKVAELTLATDGLSFSQVLAFSVLRA